MSVRRTSGQSTYFYRFMKGGRDHCAGGFRTKEQAQVAEVREKNRLFDEVEQPGKLGMETTWMDAGRWWLENVAPKKRSKKNDFARVGLAMRFFGGRKIRETAPQEIEAFLDKLPELCGEPISDHTRNHYLAMLKAVITRLKKKRLYMGENPAWYVEAIKVPKVRVRFLYPAEEKELSPVVAQAPDIFAYYYTLLHTGMRIDEVRRLRVKDVDLTMNYVFVPNSKSYRSRYVPLSVGLAAKFKEWMAGKALEERLLPDWSYQYVLRHFKALCGQAKVEQVTLHVLRHTFAARLLGKGVSIYLVSKILGHSSVKVTEEHYGHLAQQDLQAVMVDVNDIVSSQSAPAFAMDLQWDFQKGSLKRV